MPYQILAPSGAVCLSVNHIQVAPTELFTLLNIIALQTDRP